MRHKRTCKFLLYVTCFLLHSQCGLFCLRYGSCEFRKLFGVDGLQELLVIVAIDGKESFGADAEPEVVNDFAAGAVVLFHLLVMAAALIGCARTDKQRHGFKDLPGPTYQ